MQADISLLHVGLAVEESSIRFTREISVIRFLARILNY